MAVIHIPRRRLVQPQGILLPAQTQLTDGLIVLQSGREFAVGNGQAVGAPPLSATRLGLGFSGGTGRYYESPAQYKPTTGLGFSVAFEIICVSAVDGTSMFSLGNTAASGEPRLLLRHSFPNKIMGYFGGGYQINAAGTISPLDRLLVIFTHDETTASLYINGILIGTSDVAVNAGEANNWYLGSGYGAQFDAIYVWHAQWSRGLHAAEARSLSENPWQLFRADPLRIYSFPSGGITLNSLTMSNFTATGARAILSVTR